MIKFMLLTLAVIVVTPIAVAAGAVILYIMTLVVVTALACWIVVIDKVFRTKLGPLYIEFVYEPLWTLGKGWDREDES